MAWRAKLGLKCLKGDLTTWGRWSDERCFARWSWEHLRVVEKVVFIAQGDRSDRRGTLRMWKPQKRSGCGGWHELFGTARVAALTHPTSLGIFWLHVVCWERLLPMSSGPMVSPQIVEHNCWWWYLLLSILHWQYHCPFLLLINQHQATSQLQMQRTRIMALALLLMPALIMSVAVRQHGAICVGLIDWKRRYLVHGYQTSPSTSRQTRTDMCGLHRFSHVAFITWRVEWRDVRLLLPTVPHKTMTMLFVNFGTLVSSYKRTCPCVAYWYQCLGHLGTNTNLNKQWVYT